MYLAFDKRYPEKICFYFPMTEKQLEALEEKCRTYDVDEVADYLSNIWELDQFLPPRLTFRELNQIAMEIQNLADKTTVSRKKPLASLEAEVPRDAYAVCRIIRNYRDYEFLPIQELSAEGYAKYLLTSDLHREGTGTIYPSPGIWFTENERKRAVGDNIWHTDLQGTSDTGIESVSARVPPVQFIGCNCLLE